MSSIDACECFDKLSLFAFAICYFSLKGVDLVALPVRKEALKKLPAEVHPVDLSAMSYVKNRQGRPEKSWTNYFITIIGFPEGSPLTVSIGRIKGQEGNVLW